MSKNKLILSSLAMDLKRAALGYWRSSNRMADRFLQEAIGRKKEINFKINKPYIKNLFKKVEDCISQKDKKKAAEDLLTYSILFQNAALR
jgi:hypothetical protein